MIHFITQSVNASVTGESGFKLVSREFAIFDLPSKFWPFPSIFDCVFDL